jgi:hypothetical protein
MNHSGARKAFAVLALSALRASAVDGVAVSTQLSMLWPTAAGGDIIRYDIANNDVVRVTTLFNGGGGDASKSRVSGRFPAISFDGKKIAFFRCTTDSGRFVAIMNIDGSGIRNLAKIPQYNGYEAEGYLHWARISGTDWIYYMLAGDEANTEGNKRLWRVDPANPATSQEVTVFQYTVWQFGMSADASRMVLRCTNTSAGEIFKYIPPGTGAISQSNKIDFGTGCAIALSPSGQWLTYASGGSHITMLIDSWDLASQSTMQSTDINSWAVNAANLKTHCIWYDIASGIDVSLGFGTSCNRWSCNSDKWLCFYMGYPEGDGTASGRDGFCGSNQVLINWKDHIAVNASRNPRACAAPEMSAGCDKDSGVASYRLNDAGDFFVTAPVEDINADLRTSIDNRPPGRIAPAGSVRIILARSVMAVFLPAACAWRIDLIDGRGHILTSRDIIGVSCALDRASIGPGLYIMRAISALGEIRAKLIIN